MQRRILAILSLGALLVLAPACSRLGGDTTTAKSVTVETLESPSSLPASWGHLVSVSSAAQYPDLVQLWLQDGEGTIRMVVFNVTTSELVHVRRIGRQ